MSNQEKSWLKKYLVGFGLSIATALMVQFLGLIYYAGQMKSTIEQHERRLDRHETWIIDVKKQK